MQKQNKTQAAHAALEKQAEDDDARQRRVLEAQIRAVQGTLTCSRAQQEEEEESEIHSLRAGDRVTKLALGTRTRSGVAVAPSEKEAASIFASAAAAAAAADVEVRDSRGVLRAGQPAAVTTPAFQKTQQKKRPRSQMEVLMLEERERAEQQRQRLAEASSSSSSPFR